MALPPTPDRVGWWRFGSAPDERGSTVLAGHVDTRRFGIGPLARLRAVEVGDEVALALSDGRTVWYRTVRVRSIDKQSDALAAVVDEDGSSRLHVVTCGGEFDPENGGYQDNVVLTAVPLPRAAR
jgi:sortase (surface protein transpeptidase)